MEVFKVFNEATIGFEPMIRVLQTRALPLGYVALFKFNDSYGNRTRVTAVKGRCLDRLTKEPDSPSRVRTYDPSVNSRMLYR